MKVVSELTATKLAEETGIPERVCESFLRHIQRYEPAAPVRISKGHEPCARVELPFGFMLEMTKEAHGVTIGGHDGGYPAGTQFFTIIPRSCVTNANAVLDYLVRIGEAQIVEDHALTSRIREGLDEMLKVIAATRESNKPTGSLLAGLKERVVRIFAKD
jgi:hypothetical protein